MTVLLYYNITNIHIPNSYKYDRAAPVRKLYEILKQVNGCKSPNSIS